MKKKYKIGYTTGVYDMFHIGHLNILKKCKEQCDVLIVGISTDELVWSKKKKSVVIPYNERVEIVKAIKYVDKVVSQNTLMKFDAWENLRFDVMFVGDDWKGTPRWVKLDKEFAKFGVDIIYFPYTDGTSSTLLKDKLINK